jgi:hypothetical protein
MKFAYARLPRFAPVVLLASSLAVVPAGLQGQSLVGSPESMQKQNDVAREHDYSYLRTPDDVRQAVDLGDLVGIRANDDLELAFEEVSFPVARPQVKVFLEQLGRAYREACGEPLVVTSLTRPITRQPWNASPISVHPTGMAADLRRSDRRVCRQWMDRTLLALEAEGMIEATLEHYPQHYHVAVFPDPLLQPGPMGDPNGVARLVALHELSPSERVELAGSDRGMVRASLRITRSKHGRLQITQTAVAAAHPRHVPTVHRATVARATIAVHHTRHPRSAKAHVARASTKTGTAGSSPAKTAVAAR